MWANATIGRAPFAWSATTAMSAQAGTNASTTFHMDGGVSICSRSADRVSPGTARNSVCEQRLPDISKESSVFEKRLVAGWGDMDFNSHMRNTAFLDKSADVRMMFFSENGFPVEEFIREQVGPVIMKDEIEYFKEVRLLEELRVTLVIAGLAEDGSRFIIRNEFLRSNERVAAKVTSQGGWLDLTTRKLVAPPAALLAALRSLDRADDFQILSSSIKGLRA